MSEQIKKRSRFFRYHGYPKHQIVWANLVSLFESLFAIITLGHFGCNYSFSVWSDMALQSLKKQRAKENE